uniref:Aquaporin 8 n=1 Tax=Sinonovacula constricta TaxID=98310 RepID=A0A6G6CZ46_SINCO|nr:aquaporin 8 [Sinonovacula constricta]
MAGENDLLLNEEHRTSTFDQSVRPVLAELVGVTLFVFIGCLALSDGNIVGAALGHGLTITLLIVGLGEISGGHFNPAVTVGVLLSGRIRPLLALGYILGQLVGGILGAAIVRGVLPSAVYKSIGGGVHHLSPIIGDTTVEPGWGFLIETMLTLVLVFTVLMAAVNEKTKSGLAPLAIGFAVAVDIMAAGKLTGASMNPARAFGPAVCASSELNDAWKYHYIYWLGPLVGAIIAALLYRLLFASPSRRLIARYHDEF